MSTNLVPGQLCRVNAVYSEERAFWFLPIKVGTRSELLPNNEVVMFLRDPTTEDYFASDKTKLGVVLHGERIGLMWLHVLFPLMK